MIVLLDSDAYSAWRRGNPRVMTLVRGARGIVISAVVAGELLAGFAGGAYAAEDLREFLEVLEQPGVAVHPVTLVTAQRYARVTAALRAKGRPIPTNDVWIAAHAIECDAELISFDQHFKGIDGLRWIDPGK